MAMWQYKQTCGCSFTSYGNDANRLVATHSHSHARIPAMLTVSETRLIFKTKYCWCCYRCRIGWRCTHLVGVDGPVGEELWQHGSELPKERTEAPTEMLSLMNRVRWDCKAVLPSCRRHCKTAHLSKTINQSQVNLCSKSYPTPTKHNHACTGTIRTQQDIST